MLAEIRLQAVRPLSAAESEQTSSGIAVWAYTQSKDSIHMQVNT